MPTTRAMMAPTPAPSVGVKKPTQMPPSAPKMMATKPIELAVSSKRVGAWTTPCPGIAGASAAAAAESEAGRPAGTWPMRSGRTIDVAKI
jgi:hypothetical protein